jgi:hypothetical protein
MCSKPALRSLTVVAAFSRYRRAIGCCLWRAAPSTAKDQNQKGSPEMTIPAVRSGVREKSISTRPDSIGVGNSIWKAGSMAAEWG